MANDLRDIDMAADPEFIPVDEAVDILADQGFEVFVGDHYIRWKRGPGSYGTLNISRDRLVDGLRIKK